MSNVDPCGLWGRPTKNVDSFADGMVEELLGINKVIERCLTCEASALESNLAVQDMKTDMEGIQMQISDLSKSLVAREALGIDLQCRQSTHNKELSTQYNQLQSLCGELQAELAELKSQQELQTQLAKDVKAMKDRHFESCDEVLQQKEQQNLLLSLNEEKHAILQAQHQEMCGQIADLRKQQDIHSKLAHDVETMKCRHLASCDAIAKQNEQHGLLLSLHEEKHTSLQAQHQEMCGELADLRKQQEMYSKLVLDVEAMHGHHLETCKEITKQKELHSMLLSLQKKHDDLQAQHQELCGQILYFQSQQDMYSELAHDVEAMHGSHLDSTDAIAKHKERHDELQSLHHELRNQIHNAIKAQSEEHNQLMALHEELRGQLIELQDQSDLYMKSAQDIEALLGHRLDAEDAISKQKEEHKQLIQQHQQLQSQQKEQHDCLGDMLRDQLAEIHFQQELNTQLAQDVEALRGRQEDANDAMEKQKEQLDSVRSRLQALGGQISSLLLLGDAVIEQKEQHDGLRSLHYELQNNVADTLTKHGELHAQLRSQQEHLGSQVVAFLAVAGEKKQEKKQEKATVVPQVSALGASKEQGFQKLAALAD